MISAQEGCGLTVRLSSPAPVIDQLKESIDEAVLRQDLERKFDLNFLVRRVRQGDYVQ